jgi:hypothetical protein
MLPAGRADGQAAHVELVGDSIHLAGSSIGAKRCHSFRNLPALCRSVFACCHGHLRKNPTGQKASRPGFRRLDRLSRSWCRVTSVALLQNQSVFGSPGTKGSVDPAGRTTAPSFLPGAGRVWLAGEPKATGSFRCPPKVNLAFHQPDWTSDAPPILERPGISEPQFVGRRSEQVSRHSGGMSKKIPLPVEEWRRPVGGGPVRRDWGSCLPPVLQSRTPQIAIAAARRRARKLSTRRMPVNSGSDFDSPSMVRSSREAQLIEIQLSCQLFSIYPYPASLIPLARVGRTTNDPPCGGGSLSTAEQEWLAKDRFW